MDGLVNGRASKGGVATASPADWHRSSVCLVWDVFLSKLCFLGNHETAAADSPDAAAAAAAATFHAFAPPFPNFVPRPCRNICFHWKVDAPPLSFLLRCPMMTNPSRSLKRRRLTCKPRDRSRCHPVCVNPFPPARAVPPARDGPVRVPCIQAVGGGRHGLPRLWRVPSTAAISSRGSSPFSSVDVSQPNC